MVQSINALGTLIVGIAVAIISYRQYWAQRQSLRLSLFDRRFDLFKAQQRYLSAILAQGETDMSLVPEFLDARQKSNFLLNAEFCSYLDKIYSNSLDLYAIRHQMRNAPVQDRAALATKMGLLLGQLTEELPILVERYKRFLAIEG